MSKFKGTAFYRNWKWPLLFLQDKMQVSLSSSTFISRVYVFHTQQWVWFILKFFFLSLFAIAVAVGTSLTIEKQGHKASKGAFVFQG